jgi:hypothetical protein
MSEDIIETLRRIQCSDAACGNLRIAMGLKLAIYEIERLRVERDEARALSGQAIWDRTKSDEANQAWIIDLQKRCDQAVRERDLLRREVCRHRAAAIQGKRPEDIAAALQWDCFRESPLDRLAKMDAENGL